jgi:hypothetical protein
VALQAEHSAQAAVDLGHERGGEPADRRVKVGLVDGDEGRDVQHGILRQAAGDGGEETLPGTAARAVLEVMTATRVVLSVLAL